MANKPVLHRRDHEHGGADTVRIVYESVGEAGSGDAIRFDVTPQAGGFLQVTASNYINIETEGDGTDVDIDAGGSVNLSATLGIVMNGHGDDGVVIDASGDGDLVLHASGTGTSRVVLRAFATDGHYITFQGLATTDPGVPGALWNDAGTLKISP